MKVKLRNSDGQFCTLAEYCAEEPIAEVRRVSLPCAAKALPGMREALVRMERMAEIVHAFDLKAGESWRATDYAKIEITEEGRVNYCYPSHINGDDPELALDLAREILAEAEELAAKWQATEYEIED